MCNSLKRQCELRCLHKGIFKNITYLLNNLDWKDELSNHLNNKLDSEIESIIIKLGMNKPVVKDKFPDYLLNNLNKLGLIKYTDVFAKEYDIYDDEKVTLSKFGMEYLKILINPYSLKDAKSAYDYIHHFAHENILVLRPTVFNKDKSINTIESLNYELNRIIKVFKTLASYINVSFNSYDLHDIKDLLVAFYEHQGFLPSPLKSINSYIFSLSEYKYPSIDSLKVFIQAICYSYSVSSFSSLDFLNFDVNFLIKLKNVLIFGQNIPKSMLTKVRLIGRIPPRNKKVVLPKINGLASTLEKCINKHATKKEFLKLFINHPTSSFKNALTKDAKYKSIIRFINYKMFE